MHEAEKPLEQKMVATLWAYALKEKTLGFRNEPFSHGEKPVRAWLARGFQRPT